MSVDASVGDPQYHLTDHAMPFSYCVRHISALGERGAPRKRHTPLPASFLLTSLIPAGWHCLRC